jgi:hypothetical protein
MTDKKKEFFGTKITLVLFIGLFFWWIYLQIFNKGDFSLQNQIFSALYGSIALCGGIIGFQIAKKWGGLKSVIGKAISFLSFGLLAQVFGQITYSFYTFFFKIEIPYPSLGDLGYFGSIILYSIGLLYLAKATGVIFKLKNLKNKLVTLVVPAVLLFVSYWIFLKDYQFDWKSPLKILLDFGYPLGDAFYISIALLIYYLSRGILGGIMKSKIIFLLFALLIQFLADYSFLYMSYYGEMHPGSVNDFIYLLAYYFMTISLIEFLTVYHDIKKL